MTLPLVRRTIAIGAILAGGGAAAALALSPAPGAAPAADAAHPAVIELYESQGCSSCPPANANVNALAGRADVLALTFAVTYWDQLGWKDTFAKPAFTARQWEYAHAGGRAQVGTPQVIVNGRGAVVGSNAAQLVAAIRANARQPGPAIARVGDAVTIDAGRSAGTATIWLVRYDPRTLSVPVRAGENGGRTLPHRNVVRSLEAVGTWQGRAVRIALPSGGDTAYRSAILVQRGKGGPILAAARI